MLAGVQAVGPRVGSDDATSTSTRQTIGVVLAAVAYCFTLRWMYEHVIAPEYTYLKYAYRSPDPRAFGLALVLVLVLALLLPRRIGRPSHFIVWVLFLVAVVPSIVIPQISPALDTGQALTLACWVSGSFALVAVAGTRRLLRDFVPRPSCDPRTFWLVLVVATVIADIYVAVAIGFRLELPSLTDVYGLRAEFNGTEADDAVLAYLGPTLFNVVHPLILVRGLWTRRWVWVLGGAAGQFLVYSASGNKTAVLAPAALILVTLAFRLGRRLTGTIILVSGTVVSITMFLVDQLIDSDAAVSLIVRRLLVTPGLLSAGYVSVFSDLDKVHLSHSVLSPFLRYPYPAEPPDLVGAVFFGDPDTHANANIFADGYANFGYPGMVLACAVLVLILWTVDDATEGLPLGASSMMFLLLGLALGDGSVFTSILSGGFLAALVLAAVLPRDGWTARSRRGKTSSDSAPDHEDADKRSSSEASFLDHRRESPNVGM